MDWSKVRVEFSVSEEAGTRWRCPYCGIEFYGGGSALHHAGCINEVDYQDMIYILTPSGIARLFNIGFTLDGYNRSKFLESDISRHITEDMIECWREKYGHQ